jgi:hypothetical protein
MIGLVHFIALAAGIAVLLLIRKRYPGIRPKELAVIIFLYIILVFLFTEPVVNFFKGLMG